MTGKKKHEKLKRKNIKEEAQKVEIIRRTDKVRMKNEKQEKN